MRETVKLRIFKETPARLPVSRLRRLFDLIVRKEGSGDSSAQVNLVVCTDARIRSLNQRFLGIDRATDVLSFSLDALDGDDQVLGEIYISASHAAKQAGRLGKGVNEEYLLLFCHGMLHLFGHDHDTTKREKTMFKLQADYLDALKHRKQ